MKANQSRIISKMSQEFIKSLWEVLCDNLQHMNAETKLAGATIFKKLLLGSECIDSAQMNKFETYLHEVCSSMGSKDYTHSSIFECCVGLRRIFTAEDNFLTHYATGNTLKGVEFTVPSQAQIFDYLDPKIKLVIQEVDTIIQTKQVANLKEKGVEVIQRAFGSK